MVNCHYLHHLGQNCDEKQRHHHHHQHWVEENVSNLPFLPLRTKVLRRSLNRFWQNKEDATHLLEVAELAQGLGLYGVGKLSYLAQRYHIKILSIPNTNTDLAKSTLIHQHLYLT